mmetsp:Transcript_21125/g.59663  ORF Transcript_21125/g.59663 Transcript_21125/m.59663 type:complete len:92 (+) Transcript_21125:327-602(+)
MCEKEESMSSVVSSRRSNKKLCVSLRCKMSSRVGTSQVMSVPSRTEAASMYHRLRTRRRRLRGDLLQALERGALLEVVKRGTAARCVYGWS